MKTTTTFTDLKKEEIINLLYSKQTRWTLCIKHRDKTKNICIDTDEPFMIHRNTIYKLWEDTEFTHNKELNPDSDYRRYDCDYYHPLCWDYTEIVSMSYQQ